MVERNDAGRVFGLLISPEAPDGGRERSLVAVRAEALGRGWVVSTERGSFSGSGYDWRQKPRQAWEMSGQSFGDFSLLQQNVTRNYVQRVCIDGAVCCKGFRALAQIFSEILCVIVLYLFCHGNRECLFSAVLETGVLLMQIVLYILQTLQL